MINKSKKVGISVILCITMLLQSSIVLAEPIKDMDYGTDFNFKAIGQMVESIIVFEDTVVESNTITYNYENVIGEINILKDNDKIMEVKFTEGNKEDILTYDKINNKLYIDGNESIMTEEIIQNSGTYALTEKFDEKYSKVGLGKAIANFTLGSF